LRFSFDFQISRISNIVKNFVNFQRKGTILTSLTGGKKVKFCEIFVAFSKWGTLLKSAIFQTNRDSQDLFLWDKIARPHSKPLGLFYPLETCFPLIFYPYNSTSG